MKAERSFAGTARDESSTSDRVEGNVLAASTVLGYILPGVLAQFRSTSGQLVIDTAGVYRLLTEGRPHSASPGIARIWLTLEPQHDEIVLGVRQQRSRASRSEWLSSQVLGREGIGRWLRFTSVWARSAQIPPSKPPWCLVLLKPCSGGQGDAVPGLCLAGGIAQWVRRVVRMLISGVHFRELWMAYHPARATGALRERFWLLYVVVERGRCNSQWLSSITKF